MKAIQIESENNLVLAQVALPEVKEQQLLIRVRAVGINRADLLQRKGKYPPPPGESDILGLEIAGDIVALGRDAGSWQIGDRVFGLVGSGAYAEFCLLDAAMAIAIPEQWDYVQAAAVPEAFMTANETVFELGQLKKGETLLLHAAGSGVGTAAVQMAHALGAQVIGSVGDDNKIARVLALGADHVVNYKKENLFAAVKRLTQEEGVDVIEDFIGAEYLMEHLNLLKPAGRLICVSLMRGNMASLDMALVLRKRLQIKGSVMRTRSLLDKRAITERFVKRWLPLLQEGVIQPVVDRVFSFEEVNAAHAYVEANQNVGKVVLQWL